MLLHALVKGRVQGVGFRYFVRTVAKELHLNGWVRNREDGTVEVEAEGDEDALRVMEQRLWKGPHFSNVEDVQCRFTEDARNYGGFQIVR